MFKKIRVCCRVRKRYVILARLMKKYSYILISTLLFLFVGIGCRSSVTQAPGPRILDRQQILSEAKRDGLIMNDSEIALMTDQTRIASVSGINPENFSSYLSKNVSNWKGAALADVTGGGSFGLAFTTREDGRQVLISKMGNLPPLEDGFFYEGWIVRRTNEMSIVSVGAVQLVKDQFVNVFISDTDLSEYNFFVLTLESPDGNPAPGKHILEGTFR